MSTASVIASEIQKLEPQLRAYPELWDHFHKCFLNTIETTVQQSDGDTFVITGDIPAMWLRDSTAQVLHYLRFADHSEVADMVEGLLQRQADCILRDPYANSFNREEISGSPHNRDLPRVSGWVWERKYEIDSLCYPLWLAEKFYKKTGRTAFLNETFAEALQAILTVFRTEQNHSTSPYYFIRTDCPPSDTLTCEGRGEPVAVTGMTWSGFRPSDDACKYGYLVPSNLFAVRALKSAEKLASLAGWEDLAAQSAALGAEIAEGVRKHGLVEHPEFGRIYAYEVDGLGNANLMDDANVPSLLALPYLEVCEKDDPLYLRTRAFVLSSENPYYYQGSLARGIGSPHTPAGYIWPIALCVQAMTSTDVGEIANILKTLMNTHGGTGFMHESFDPNAPEQFTRDWFAWANSMFGELVFRLYEEGTLSQVIREALA